MTAEDKIMNSRLITEMDRDSTDLFSGEGEVNISDLISEARVHSSKKKFKLFSDLSDPEQEKEYNKYIQDAERYEILKGDGAWKGTSSRSEKYTMLMWYVEYNLDDFNELLVAMLKKYDWDVKNIIRWLSESADNYSELRRKLLYNN